MHPETVANKNLTIQLDEDTIRAAKVVAAKRGTSVSALVAKRLRDLIAADARYERARRDALRALAAGDDRGGAEWSREELSFERWRG